MLHIFCLSNLYLLTIFLFGLFESLLSEMIEPQKEFDTESTENDYYKRISNDGRYKFVDKCSDCGAIEDAGDDNHDDVVINCTRIFDWMALKDQSDEVEECCTHDERIANDSRC